ncbi:hypothetical protein BOTBODRAFT_54843 [Botryobasidium botryosum FD-172 SS1]|uniref:Uncharacterized protein n=1 Tax=Botryobasidium botryosum (strain FD-172 SS1) TaxID=930990 RepID=A0A067MHJ4_BOTB1|nr:hypothetical protein BOTBODRAFT_54843 [Botryobasidium botryosum FD-172 SS1]
MHPVPLPYSSECPEFPANGPIGAPHIIGSATFSFHEEIDQKNLRLADGLVTHLYRHNPEVAKAFFDLRRAKFEYTLRRTPPWYTISIARFGRMIQVGYIKEGEYIQKYIFLLSKVEKKLIPLAVEDANAGVSTTRAASVDAFAKSFGRDLLYDKDWNEDPVKIVSRTSMWTKLPQEEGYGEIDRLQEEIYGLPEGWENMTDEQLGIPQF